MKSMKIFAVTAEQSQRVTNDFRNRMTDGTLPEAIRFEFETKEEKTLLQEPTNEEVIVDLFGKDNVIITED